MEQLLGFLTRDKCIKGVPLDEKLMQLSLRDLLDGPPTFFSTKGDYQNENECFFTAFNQLACAAFHSLSQQNCKLKEENQVLKQENVKARVMCKKMKKDLANAKDTIQLQQENMECKTCQLNQGELQQYEQKYQNLEMQLKKCALIINSSLDGGARVLGRVKDILTQSVVDDSNLNSEESKTLNSSDRNEELHQKSLSQSKYFVSTKPILSTDEDDDATILAPPSPENCDMETQHFDGLEKDFVVCVPETIPFDYPPQGVISNKLFHGAPHTLSPIIRQKTPLKPTVKKSVSPLKKFASPIKRIKAEPLESLDTSVFSPTLLEDFTSQPLIQNRSKSDQEIGFSKQPKNERFRPTKTTTNLYENLDPQKRSLNNDQRTDRSVGLLTEQHQQTPKSQKNKALKQTKLTLNRQVTDRTSERTNVTTATRMSTKTVRISPQAQVESKRRRRGKDPEDWPCKECYRLFREAEAAKKIDVRKMPVAMNFCPEHFNRYSYYLNTPPSFWDCGIGKAPRNGHLHPLDASAAKADDDDDFVE